MKYARVAVEGTVFSFDKEFDYIIPSELESDALKGCRVTVPFGIKNQKRIGYIFEITDSSDGKKLKKVIDIIDEEPLLNDEMIELARWIKDRTFCTFYEAAKAMLPTGINNKMVISYAFNPDYQEGELDNLGDTEKEIYLYLKKRLGCQKSV